MVAKRRAGRYEGGGGEGGIKGGEGGIKGVGGGERREKKKFLKTSKQQRIESNTTVQRQNIKTTQSDKSIKTQQQHSSNTTTT